MEMNDMRRMTAALLDRPDISEAVARWAMGHTFENIERESVYLPTMQNVDLMGLAIDGKQSLDVTDCQTAQRGLTRPSTPASCRSSRDQVHGAHHMRHSGRSHAADIRP